MSLGLAFRNSSLISLDALDIGESSPNNKGISKAPLRLIISLSSFSKETIAAASLGVIKSSVFLFAARITACSIPSFLHTLMASRISAPKLIWCLNVTLTQVFSLKKYPASPIHPFEVKRLVITSFRYRCIPFGALWPNFNLASRSAAKSTDASFHTSSLRSSTASAVSRVS